MALGFPGDYTTPGQGKNPGINRPQSGTYPPKVAQPQQPAGLDSLNSLFNTYLNAYSPQMANAVNQYGNISDQLGLVGPMYSQQRGNVRQSENLGLQNLYWQGQGLGINQAANVRQTNLANQLWGSVNVPQEELARQNWGLQTQSHNLSAQQFPLMQKQLYANAAASGSLNTGGARDQNANLAREKQQFNLNWEQQQHNWQSHELGYHGELLGHREQMQQMKDAGRMIGIAQKQLGVSYGDVVNRANTAIQQLGLDQVMTTSQLFQALSDAANGIYNPISQAATSVANFAGLSGIAGSAGGQGKVKGGSNPTAYSGSTQSWIKDMLPNARIAAQQLGIPVSAVLSQWINETGGGKNYYSGVQGRYNPAGISTMTSDLARYGGTPGQAPFVDFPNALSGTLGYVARWNEGVYAPTRQAFAAANGNPLAVLQAMANSPWAAGHYSGGAGLTGPYYQYNLHQYD